VDTATLLRYRHNKDSFFSASPHSPLAPNDRAGFEGLAYFDPNPDLVFTVDVTPVDPAEVAVGTSDGSERTYRRAGSIALDVAGRRITLTLFDTGNPGYFLPFRDATSGTTTYGAGRYLDLHPNPDGTVTVDFNLAYNPFCAYADAYSCALPPHENWIDIPIPAGELTYVRRP
jgi:uncharacterized protein (DUF1684 family)